MGIRTCTLAIAAGVVALALLLGTDSEMACVAPPQVTAAPQLDLDVPVIGDARSDRHVQPLQRVAAPHRAARVVQVLGASATGPVELANATVSVLSDVDADPRSATRVDGGFAVTDDRVQIDVSAAGFVSRRVILEEGDAGHQILLQPRAALTLLFQDEHGAPVAGIRTALFRKPDQSAHNAGPGHDAEVHSADLVMHRSSDADGAIQWQGLEGLADYRYAILSEFDVLVTPAGSTDRPNVSGTIRLPAGTATYKVVVRGGRIMGQLPLVTDCEDVCVVLEHLQPIPGWQPGARPSTSLLSGKMFEALRTQRPRPSGAANHFCFAGLAAGEYCIRAHWRLGSSFSFATRYVRLTEGRNIVDLGVVRPLETEPVHVLGRLVATDTLAEVPPPPASRPGIELRLNAGSAIRTIDDFDGYILDDIVLYPGEPVQLLGIPRRALQLRFRKLHGSLPDGWSLALDRNHTYAYPEHLDRFAQLELDVPCDRLQELSLEAILPDGANPERALLVMCPPEGPPIHTEMQLVRRGVLLGACHVRVGSYGLYVRVECDTGVFVGLCPQANSGASTRVHLERSKEIELLAPPSLRGMSVAFGPTDLPAPIDAASVGPDGRLSIRGLPAGSAIALYGVPEQALLTGTATDGTRVEIRTD